MPLEKRTAGANPSKYAKDGPFVARVVSHLDPKRMGTLEVELLSTAGPGNDPNFEKGQLFTAKYCMPFYGVNNVQSNTAEWGYSNTQQSYGFWAVPPDPGSKVLVIFAEGLPNQCYWIGCIQDEYMNNMVPSGGQITTKPAYVYQGNLPNDIKGQPLPTGEYNKKQTDKLKGQNVDQFIRSYNPLFARVLSNQGLVFDTLRGQTTSSARRDVPNTVYGWNTPGPLDKRPGAPTGKYGAFGEAVNYFRSRLGGSTFTMDDGDPTILRQGLPGSTPSVYYDIEAEPKNASKADPTLPANELVRIRTRTGHQILLHNTEDLIYIGNAKGSAWLEMTSNGKIDIYASDSINIRTETDLNITADRDINILAGRDFNLTSLRDKKVKVGVNNDVRIGENDKKSVGVNQDLKVSGARQKAIGEDEDVQIAGSQNTTISGSYSLQVAGDGKIAINGEFGSKVAGNYRQTVVGAFNLNTLGDNKFTSGANTQILSTGNHKETAAQIHMNSASQIALSADSISDTFTEPVTNDATDKTLGSTGSDLGVPVTTDASRAVEAAEAKTPRRVPLHEPWDQHESYNPSEYTPAVQESIIQTSPSLRRSTPTLEKESDMPERNSTSGVFRAGDTDPKIVDIDKVFKSDDDGEVGAQPDEPISELESQRFFLSELIKGLGLDPAKALTSGAAGGAGEAIAMACAQIKAESNFIPKSENLNYSAAGLRATFRMFKKPGGFELSEQLHRKPVEIGSVVYGSRMGNGGPETGDGYRYRGRGLIQLTGTDNYKLYGGFAGVNIYKNPELANDPKVACKLAVAYLTKGPKAGFITWTDTNFSSLGQQFKNAIGYADLDGSKTVARTSSGRGFWQRIKNGDLTPLADVTTPKAIDTAGGESKVQ